MRISYWSSDVCSSDLRIIDSNRTLLGQNANVGLIRGAGVPLLGTPFNSGGYTLTELSQAFRTYEDFGRIRTKTWSVFANADAVLTDQLKLTVGVRYTEDKRSEEHTSELPSLMRISYAG